MLVSRVFVLLMAIVVCVLCEKEVCQDNLSSNRCKYLAKYNACATHRIRMELFCNKSCNFCKAEATKAILNPLRHNRCATIKCPWNKKCVLDENYYPYCKCHIRHCRRSKKTGSVCTKSGRHFNSLCALLHEECETGEILAIKHYGDCQPKDTCVDAERESKHKLCESWKNSGFCESEPREMKLYCAKTCALCVQYAPPKCESSPYGCCWWKKDTSAIGPYGEGCRNCVDLEFCRHFVAQCGDPLNKRFMKKNCPKTCHYCVNDNTND